MIYVLFIKLITTRVVKCLMQQRPIILNQLKYICLLHYIMIQLNQKQN